MELRPYQVDLLDSARHKFKSGMKRLIMYAPTGAGKCFARGTPILMFDGEIKSVENIKDGDLLMGPDSLPRKVFGTIRGYDDLFKVTPKKGDPYIVNSSHILSVSMTGNRDNVSLSGRNCRSGDVVNLSLAEWFGATRTFRHCAKGWRSGVVFEGLGKLPIPPYIFGLWLGDGAVHAPALSSVDQELIDEWSSYAKSIGCMVYVDDYKSCKTYHVTNGNIGGRKKNPFTEALRQLKIYKRQKFIPHGYKVSSRIERLNLLAGIIDTDGHLSKGYYDLIFKEEKLANDVAFVARSLGFASYVKKCKKRATNSKSQLYGEYFRVSISGHIFEIPCKLPRKKASPRKQKKDVLKVGIAVDYFGTGTYYGFSLDGPDHLFLLGDFTVAHNTETAMSMVKMARDKGTRVLFVANRIGLVDQASRRFYKSGIEHGIIQGGNTRQMDSGVLVCSIQTLAKRGFPPAGLLVIDEAHACAGSKAYRDLMMQYPGIPIVGLTATPFSKGLGKAYTGFGPLFEGIAKSVTITDLIKLGYLVDIDIWAPSEPDLTEVKIVAGDYNELQLGIAVDKPQLVGDIVNHWKRLGGNKQTVCFATNISHSKHIMEQFNSAGIKCEHLDCYTEDDERRQILKNIDNGNTRVVTNCAVLAEGWDSPSVEVMICARPTRSLIRWIQMSGRILRPFEGKDRAIILDHSGTAKRLGFPTDDLPLELDDGKPNKAGQREKEEALPKICPKCQYLKPPKTHMCPRCGFAPEKQNSIETEDGKLEKLQRKEKLKPTTEEKAIIYAELLGYARERGFKDGWAWHACRELFDAAPRATKIEPIEPTATTRKLIQHLNIRRAKAKDAVARRQNAAG
jgi:superfamily II DNA or RNA helicase